MPAGNRRPPAAGCVVICTTPCTPPHRIKLLHQLRQQRLALTAAADALAVTPLRCSGRLRQQRSQLISRIQQQRGKAVSLPPAQPIRQGVKEGLLNRSCHHLVHVLGRFNLVRRRRRQGCQAVTRLRRAAGCWRRPPSSGQAGGCCAGGCLAVSCLQRGEEGHVSLLPSQQHLVHNHLVAGDAGQGPPRCRSHGRPALRLIQRCPFLLFLLLCHEVRKFSGIQ